MTTPLKSDPIRRKELKHRRTHQGKMCCATTPFQTMIEGKEIWTEKFIN